MVIGVANAGGHIPASWFGRCSKPWKPTGSVSGMHAAGQPAGPAVGGRQQPPTDRCAHTASRHSDRVGLKRSGRRLLTVGTDCALGKKYTALAIARGLQGTANRCDVSRHRSNGNHDRRRGMLDSVVADFIAALPKRFRPTRRRNTWTSSKGKGQSFIRLTLESRWVCFTAASPIASSCVMSRAARTCSAIPHSTAVDRASHRTDDRTRSPHQSRHSLCRNQPEHRETRRGRRARIRQRRKAAVTAGRGSDAGGPAFERLLDACE